MFKAGDLVTFNTTEEDGFRKYNGRNATILNQLPEDDVNHEYHTGDTFRIRFRSGAEIDAFDFELAKA